MSVDKKITKYLKEADMEARRARAEWQVIYNTIDNIMDDAIERAEDQVMIAQEKIDKIYRKAVADVVKELDEASDAAEGAWGIPSRTVDKFFKDKYQELVAKYVTPHQKIGNPMVEPFWDAVQDEWIETR
jgi:ElaB/YqjD/DUF883 family membrane-anchored ribosome-binding protein